MKKLLFFFLMLGHLGLFAQYMELGLLGGVSNYQGDVAPSSVWNSVGQSHAMVGGFARYNINPFLGTRLSFSRGLISGDDSQSDNQARRNRNLHFVTPITEVALLGEINLFGYRPSNLHSDFSPYLFFGVGLFHFNPQTEYFERWVELQPLGTEGQGMDGYEEKYKKIQWSIPFGGGIKLNLNEEWTLGLEVGLRKTFTDYLDDVSGFYVNHDELFLGNGAEAAALGNRSNEYLNLEPRLYESGTRVRGNPENKDWYLFGSLTVSYNFMYKGLLSSSFISRHLGCPKKF